MYKNTKDSFGSLAKFFHWVIALLLIIMFVVAYTMMAMQPSDQKFMLYDLHKSTGMVIFALVLARLVWRWSNPMPDLPKTLPQWQIKAERWVTFALYLFMIIFPLSGLMFTIMGNYPLHFFFLFEIPPLHQGPSALTKVARGIHTFSAYGLGFLFAVHAGAALYHHFIKKDEVLNRMLPHLK